jgi:hypothetical protein
MDTKNTETKQENARRCKKEFKNSKRTVRTVKRYA